MPDTPTPLTIRPLAEPDIPQVLVIEERSYATPWHEGAYRTELGNRSARYLVAEIDGRIAGYGGMWLIMDEAHVTTLAVDEAMRRQGIGARLLEALMDEAIAAGANRATLEVRESNVGAQQLYRRFGFRDAAIRRRYYTNNNENAIVMWADDLQSDAFRALLDDIRAARCAGPQLDLYGGEA